MLVKFPAFLMGWLIPSVVNACRIFSLVITPLAKRFRAAKIKRLFNTYSSSLVWWVHSTTYFLRTLYWIAPKSNTASLIFEYMYDLVLQFSLHSKRSMIYSEWCLVSPKDMTLKLLYQRKEKLGELR